MPELKFNLGDRLRILASEEEGEVIGIAVYTHSEPTYQLRYKAADGRAVENWWTEGALGSV